MYLSISDIRIFEFLNGYELTEKKMEREKENLCEKRKIVRNTYVINKSLIL